MSDPTLQTLELKIAKFLRYGVIVAGLLMLAGWLTQLQLHGNPLQEFKDYKTISLTVTVTQMWARHEWGILTAYLGLLVLISLPMIRVLLTAILFTKQKEFILSAIAAFVLIALCVSFSLGFEI
jgi:uncharacterized membrane protein